MLRRISHRIRRRASHLDAPVPTTTWLDPAAAIPEAHESEKIVNNSKSVTANDSLGSETTTLTTTPIDAACSARQSGTQCDLPADAREDALICLLSSAELETARLGAAARAAEKRVSVLETKLAERHACVAALLHDLGVVSAEAATLRDDTAALRAAATKAEAEAATSRTTVARLSGALVLAAHVLAETESRGALELELAHAGVPPPDLLALRHADPTALETCLRSRVLDAARAAYEGTPHILDALLARVPTAASALAAGKTHEASLGEETYALLYPK